MKTISLPLGVMLAGLGLLLASRLAAQTNLTVGPATYTSGQNLTFTAVDSIGTTGSVVVSSGATIAFQAGNRVTLSPGFQAATGGAFHVTIPDADGDGISDFLETLYGLNPNVNDAQDDLDHDGVKNIQEFQNGTAPNDPSTAALPTTIYYANPQSFDYSGAVQTFVVPAGVVRIKAKVWGAGGGAGYEFAGLPKISGGSGGYSEMEFGVVSGETLTLIVGEGGQSRRQTATFGGGGFGEYWSGAGGGRSEVSAPNGSRVIAGGGGGGGSNLLSAAPLGQGGNGGGANQNGLAGNKNNADNSALGGAGGTLSVGGAGGSPYASSGAGASLQGQGTPGLAGSPYHGGGGGGGYFGGGAGSSWPNSDGRQAAGGGGGSGYVSVGLNPVGYQNNNSSDPYWGALAGTGGKNGAGGHGRIVLLLGYASAVATPQITSASNMQFTKGSGSTYQIVASNSPTSYEIIGDPPPGMTVNASTGQITGTPTQLGNYRFMLKASNAAGTGTRDLTLSVTDSATLFYASSYIYSVTSSTTVPSGTDSVMLKVWGAGGGSASGGAMGGQGGFSQMEVSTSGGESMQIVIGAGGGFAEYFHGGWGGGASAVSLSNGAVIAAGGGGGAGILASGSGATGGNGGNGGGLNLSGVAGASITSGSHTAFGGGGATVSAVGTGGTGYTGSSSGNGQNGVSSLGGTGGVGGLPSSPYFAGGYGGAGVYVSVGGTSTLVSRGGGGGGAFDYNYPNGTLVVGAGGGGSAGYAINGGNVIGYSDNHSGDSDWGNSAGSPGNAASSYTGYSGRVVIKFGSKRPTLTSPATWSIAQGARGSYSITTGLVATNFTLQSGVLPLGLALDARTGVISGVPLEIGTFALSLAASNDVGISASQAVTIVVTPAAGLQQNIPFVAGFEPYERYAAGATLVNQNGWLVTQGAADVVNATAPQGQNYLRVAGAATLGVARHNFIPSPTNPSVVFVDCLVRLTADTAVAAASRVDANGSWIALAKSGSTGEVKFFNASGPGQGAWQGTGKTYALDGTGQTVNWIRLTIRQDYSTKQWDLYLDGALVALNVGLVDPTAVTFGEFSLQGHASGATFLDRLVIANDNVLFLDADRDGMDDNWERANGLNPALNDRAGDLDGDGLLNIVEFRYGSRAALVDTDGDGLSDAQEVQAGTNPTVPAAADPTPPGITLLEPIGATLNP